MNTEVWLGGKQQRTQHSGGWRGAVHPPSPGAEVAMAGNPLSTGNRKPSCPEILDLGMLGKCVKAWERGKENLGQDHSYENEMKFPVGPYTLFPPHRTWGKNSFLV